MTISVSRNLTKIFFSLFLASHSARQVNRCLHSNYTRYLRTLSTPNLSKAGGSPNEPQNPSQQQTKESFDEFRAREEQREAQFESQYAAEAQKTQNTEDTNAEEKVSSVQLKILDAALAHVETLGWSKQALAKGAESLGYPGIAHGMFNRGGGELVDYFSSKCNKELIRFMEDMRAQQEKMGGKPEPSAKFVFKSIQFRLRMVQPYKTQWPQALALMTRPPNVPTALSNVLTMVDDICYYAGDRSVDVSFFCPLST